MSANSFSFATQDERVMAALSHGAILLPGWGVFVPILVWLTQKDKSRYVAFQALQALVFHVVQILAMMVLFGCYMAGFMVPFASIFMMALTGQEPGAVEPFVGGFFLPFLVFPLFFVVTIVFMVYGVIGAIQTLQGRDFRYLFIGSRLERWLAK